MSGNNSRQASNSSLNAIAAASVLDVGKNAKTLEDSLHSAKLNAFHMKKSLANLEGSSSTSSADAPSIAAAQLAADPVKYASLMLQELQFHPNSTIDPKQYYELYIFIFDQLLFLQTFLSQHCIMANVSPVVPSALGDFADSEEPSAAAAESDKVTQQETDKLNTMQQHKSKLAELYELVQYTTNVVPRMYLMITVGSVYIQQANAPVRGLILDMLDMCKGVQHPMRGLFLRYYLLQMLKNHLPSGPIDSFHGSLKDSIYFVVQNFTEMNKLWVRLQYQGHSRDRAKREQERKELRILVGSNLVRLSQLDGLNVSIYAEILPRILEQIVMCKDVIAQEYLIEAIIQVFPDDFHLKTLGPLLEATGKLHPQVNIKNLMISFVDRFSAFAKRAEHHQEEEEDGTKKAGGIPDDINLFEIFWEQISNTIKNRPDLSLEHIVALLQSLAKFTMSCYAEHLEYYSKIINLLRAALETSKAADLENIEVIRGVMEIVRAPLMTYPSILTLVDDADVREHMEALIVVLPFALRRAVAVAVADCILQKLTVIATVAQLETILDWLAPLVKDQKDGEYLSEGAEVWMDEQCLVAKIVHLLYSEDVDVHFLLLSTARKQFMEGGAKRLLLTIPSLVSECMKLAARYGRSEDEEKKSQALFKFTHQAIALLESNEHHTMALKLFLLVVSDKSIMLGHEMICYGFIVQAFTIYEESISDSKLQISMLQLMIGTLFSISNSGILSADGYDTLASKCALYASKLLKKEDQCRMVLASAILFWGRDLDETEAATVVEKEVPLPLEESAIETLQKQTSSISIAPELELSPWADSVETAPVVETKDAAAATVSVVRPSAAKVSFYRDAKRTLECLQKSLKIADSCMDSLVSAQLFVEILNYYGLHFGKGNECVSVKYVNGLVDLVLTNVGSLHAEKSDVKATTETPGKMTLAQVEAYLLKTLQHMQTVKLDRLTLGSDQDKARWGSIAVDEALHVVKSWL